MFYYGVLLAELEDINKFVGKKYKKRARGKFPVFVQFLINPPPLIDMHSSQGGGLKIYIPGLIYVTLDKKTDNFFKTTQVPFICGGDPRAYIINWKSKSAKQLS